MLQSGNKGFVVHKPKKSSNKYKKGEKLVDPLDVFEKSIWFQSFTNVWKKVEDQLKSIGDDVMKVLLEDIVKYVEESPDDSPLIPTAILLTGVNLPDHSSLFERLKVRLQTGVSPHVALLSSADCLSLKHTIELIVCQLSPKHEISSGRKRKVRNGKKRKDSTDSSEVESSSEDSDDELMDQLMETDKPVSGGSPPGPRHLRKTDLTLPSLSSSYRANYLYKEKKNKLIIVFKDFEGFQLNIFHKLISILSGYLGQLPFVLVFGVATTEAAVGESLTHQISSKLSLKVFQSQPSIYFLNNTIDKVFLTPCCPFQLSGKLLKFFTDVFLFYDFSVHQFTQGIKYCVMDHFYDNDIVGLFCQEEDEVARQLLSKNIKDVSLKNIESLESIKKYLENRSPRSTGDKNLTEAELLLLLSNLRKKISKFYVCLRILHTLVKDLPGSPLGKQLRELYCLSMSKDVTLSQEFKECIQYLKFSSKDELENKVSEILAIISEAGLSELKESEAKISGFKTDLQRIGAKIEESNQPKSPMKIDLNVKNRSQLKQRLAEMSSRPQTKSGYEALRERTVDYLMTELLSGGGGGSHPLLPYPAEEGAGAALWEAVLVRGGEARSRVVPRIRAPLHAALNNPHHYLQCDCCELTDELSILPSMPDLCIAYKLHLEAGSLINIYDWLQSFSMIVDGNSEKKNIEDVNEVVQARFTQSLAELEFLGFIKSSTRKADHVTRLTWGGTS